MRFLVFFSTSVILLFFSTIVWADYLVKSIEINGNQRIEKETVLSYLGISEGDEYTREKVNSALKELYKTGLFSDITIEMQEGNLLVKLTENPIVNKVFFEGNKRVDDKTLKAEVRLSSSDVYTKSKVQSDVKRIQEIYRKNGRFSVVVEPKVIILDQNRMDIVFEIDEGKKTTVRKIDFIGNKRYSDTKLKKIINTEETKWYKFYSTKDRYDPDKLAFDKELLRKFYVSRGYADFKVISSVAEITKAKDAFRITFIIEEGEKYNFGEIKVKSKLENLKVEALRSAVETYPDELFNAELIDKTIESMTEKLNNMGYAFVDITPNYDRDAENNVMGITYSIKEGPKFYVNRINIHGNVRTLDEVIRREFRIDEGDPYNAAKIKRSRQRVQNLGFFEKVELTKERTEFPDKVDINVEVKEQSTGELNFGAGYSTTNGALANVSIRERNLLGKGQDLKIAFQKATRATDIALGFTEPYFLGRDIAAGFDIFSSTRDRISESSFDQESRGVDLRASYSITEHLRHSLKYSIREDRVSDVQADASIFIKEQSGEKIVSAIGHSLVWDHLDNRLDPSEGYIVRINQDFAGVGGDSKFIGHSLRAAHYVPVYRDDVVLSMSARFGNVTAWDGKVRIDERFFIGGTDFRGFEISGIGPRDKITEDALGGNTYYVGSTELKFPLGLPEELGVHGAFFIDAGSLTGIDDSGSNIIDTGSLRLSAGVGVAWSSPLGPVRVNLTKALIKDDLDRTKQFDINFGTRF